MGLTLPGQVISVCNPQIMDGSGEAFRDFDIFTENRALGQAHIISINVKLTINSGIQEVTARKTELSQEWRAHLYEIGSKNLLCNIKRTKDL